jgi:hypothetical protein
LTAALREAAELSSVVTVAWREHAGDFQQIAVQRQRGEDVAGIVREG